MKKETLEKIKQDIRKNWNKVLPFAFIPKPHFNCYMFAICCTIPTEILKDDGVLENLTGDSKTYFSSIGNFSGSTYHNQQQQKQALLNDLDTLGITAEEVTSSYTPSIFDRKSVLIAFYSNYIPGMFRKHEEFHFLRYVPSRKEWMGKEGYPGGFQHIGRGVSIDAVNVINQNLIGIFKLQLK